MANTRSAKKAIRQIERRADVNRARRSRMRTFVRKLEEAIASGDKGAASTAFVKAESEIARSALKGIIHRNTAARKVARLAKRVKAMSA